ncbi:menaquinone biosynthesis decarboxylase [Campylobacter fetus]|uniref:1,4-dihydroxy-2-naphthoate octaprenyltransferase n=3 Tax=Campylobacter fetus TaxID=196 RepID=A0AAE6M9N9_CAMFE|nr:MULTISPECIES: menaquinone biosynthesis decarboxylase [Campylobacter]OCS22246.1 3-octaprenyl-4-hydroxybenzoate carboxy-lyase [Campylobacter fetus subsp. venerealis cfvi97/532]OCS26048.1 3-octaprenyl-4-hydroxybenzoate carboxy-lyase [Campylobacter fetus subsp. venerealis cfvB10]OCS29441.1 3-octaprenyl-4-hydroxybenzoate carboxy-lyase [Campylobacter fetus subsp. venerealis LMG 6570 = CCUG 33900]OCS40341.1 3-octaprenyl-4-hydroxybenzoate carboxy-lyase [Campylobacter fetus subsp. venerealis cfvi02/2
MQKYIDLLDKNGLLKIIDKPCDIDLEIAHLSYIEVKKDNSKALLFTNPIDKNGKKFDPVLTNIFGSFKALNLIFGKDSNEIANEIEKLLKPTKPSTLKEKIEFFTYLLSLKSVFPKRLKTKGISQECEFKEPNLYDLPILKTWEEDGGAFITMGQVYTKDLNSNTQNLGMYRLQVHSKNELGMHWQIHKDAAHFFHEYKKAGLKMPVSVAIGGDPLYIWCGQAPLPKNIFELMLYGFIRKTPAKLVKSLTNDIFIPHDSDYVIEGFVDTNRLKNEGKFGDHTGFYTPVEPFPVMEVTKITHKKNPIFHATVVGKPPLEDKFMGYATERIFLPLLKTTAPELVDYKMPENGVFHNLILAKFNALYPAHATQLMHAFWGVGQMSFVKHAVFVPSSAPHLDDYANLTKYILNRFSPQSMLITSGVCDQLDHASPNACFGGKLGIDASVDNSSSAPNLISDDKLLYKFKSVNQNILELKQYFLDTKSPICFVKFDKDRLVKQVFDELKPFDEHFKILIFVDVSSRLENLYMLVWRITNNIDAKRDIFVRNELVCIDATSKFELDGYTRGWPKETNCSKEVIENLIKKGLLERDEELFEKFEIFG